MEKRRSGQHLVALDQSDDLATESLRSLRTVLNFSMGDGADKVIMLTGPAPGVGKSFISSNFAALLAQSLAKVLLLDGDLRRGDLHHYFGLKSRQNGFGDVLAGRLAWRAAVHPTGIPGLDLMPTGLLPSNPAELLMAPSFPAFLRGGPAGLRLHRHRRPAGAGGDGPHHHRRTGGHRAAGGQVRPAPHGRDPDLPAAPGSTPGCGLLGCVFNDVQPTVVGNLGSNYQYAYHYSYKA